MRLKFRALVWSAFVFAASFAFAGLMPATAQENTETVVDEVVAQVNDGVITLSMIKRELKEAIEQRKSQGVSEQQATSEVNARQAELIASLINEQLLLQKGKELELANEVEAEVNKRMLEVAKEQGITTIEKLSEVLAQQGQNIEDVRKTLRSEIMKGMVMNREVDAKLYYGFTDKEVKDYFNAHQDKFKKPESVALSEIFLSFAGKTEADVRAKADQLVAQLRAGADFGKLAAANSERIDQNGERIALKNQGKVGVFQMPDLRPDIAGAVKDVKVGQVSQPLRSDEGYQILRVDERTAGSDKAVFNDNEVRQVMLAERADKERQAYLQTLRDEAYIKINDNYRDQVAPFLKLKTQSAAENTAKPDDKKGKKSEKKP